jgi:hypothetical protein
MEMSGKRTKIIHYHFNAPLIILGDTGNDINKFYILITQFQYIFTGNTTAI